MYHECCYDEEASDDGSTEYSEYCDDDTIRAAAQVTELISSAPSSTALGKRKSPDEPGPFDDRSPINYKRRTISSFDSVTASSEATLFDALDASLASDDIPRSQPEYDGPEPYIIAYNGSVQRAMDARGIPWGTQWEIARLVTLGYCSWKDVSMSALDCLRNEGLSTSNPNSESPSPSPAHATVLNARIAPYVEDLFHRKKISFGTQRRTREVRATWPWEELDREDAAFRLYGQNSCLGFTPELGDWYGGKVSFTLKLQVAKDGTFKFLLDHPVLGPSTRFTRSHGSAWLIRLKLPKDVTSRPGLSEKLRVLLLRPFVLNGLVFRFFYCNREHNVYLMATNEVYDGCLKSPTSPPLGGRYISFIDFFLEHNNPKTNPNQTIAKWAARTALGLSSTIPGLLLDTAQIREEADIASPRCPPGMKPPSEMDMTDGCGLINLQALYHLHQRLSLWHEVPTAIQCRLGGAKGLLLLHPGKEENRWEHPCVWLRPSQIKIKNTEIYLRNPAHRIIDVLRAAHMQGSVQISREMIINLSENGVPCSVFTDLFSQSMNDTISPLLDWDGDDAMPRLWAAVSREGNVMASRMARESAWTARARNHHLYDRDDDDDDNEDEDDVDGNTSHSTAWWGDDLSGCPSSLEETVMTFLDAGFHPTSNPILSDKLYAIAKKAVKTMSKYRVTIPMSCSALIVPDVLGVLQEGEIHVKSSQRCLLRPDGQKSDRIFGDVLVTRSPCKLPTDVQKVKAVFRPELDDYVNVIMFSIKGPRSLASMLGTGDYDGDRVVCIWEPSIVERFTNANAKHMEPPSNLNDYFHIRNETVGEFLQRVPSTSPTSIQIREMQGVLMAPLHDLFVVGTYSNLHDNAIYSLGYSHSTTTLLAWIFCTVLDGAKSGMTILPARYQQDRNDKIYGTQYTPHWKMVPGRMTHQLRLTRPDDMSKFVMDLLQDDMEKESDKQLRRIDEHFSALRKVKDLDLVAPWQDAEAGARELLAKPESERRMREVGQAQMDALEAIKTHVVRVCHWCSELMVKTIATGTTSTTVGTDASSGSSSVATTGKRIATPDGKSWFTTRSIERRQDLLRRMSHEFVSGPPAGETWVFGEEEVGRLRASYAYLYDWTRKPGGTRFPWNVAMRELGLIKLRARKDLKPISQEFYEKMSMRKL